jgi:hypothetical protein
MHLVICQSATVVIIAVICGIYTDCGITVWPDGENDIAPMFLYERSIPADADIA